LLFFLLACDLLISYRIIRNKPTAAAAA